MLIRVFDVVRDAQLSVDHTRGLLLNALPKQVLLLRPPNPHFSALRLRWWPPVLGHPRVETHRPGSNRSW